MSQLLTKRLVRIISESNEVMGLLKAGRELKLSNWCLGAGLIRSLVWDALEGLPYVPADDVDLVFYDPAYEVEADRNIEIKLAVIYPYVNWEVTNQAHVHTWYSCDGQTTVLPLLSLDDGISTWPEYCTAVGASLDHDNQVSVHAPYGLDDLFSMTVRYNPKRAAKVDFDRRVQSKFTDTRWSNITIIDR